MVVLLQWTWVYIYKYIPFWVSVVNFGYLAVELLNYMVFLFLIFWGAFMVFSTVTIQIYIPTNGTRGLSFFHIFIITYYLLPFDNSYSDRCEVVSHVFFLIFLMIMLVMHNKQVMLAIISIFKNFLIGFLVCFFSLVCDLSWRMCLWKVRMCIWKVCMLYWLQIECCIGIHLVHPI